MFSLAGLLSSWRLIGAGLAVAAFLAVSTLAAVRGHEVRALTAEKAQLAAQVSTLAKHVSTQNAAVAALKQASDDQAVAARKARAAAERAVEAANARAVTLTHAPIPAACPEALEWLRSTVDDAETARGAQ